MNKSAKNSTHCFIRTAKHERFRHGKYQLLTDKQSDDTYLLNDNLTKAIKLSNTSKTMAEI